MAEGMTCDRCGKLLLVDERTRYRVVLDVFAAYDVMEVTREELWRDHRDEIRRLLEELEEADAETVQDQVHRHLEYDLCPVCQRAYLRDPLGKGGK